MKIDEETELSVKDYLAISQQNAKTLSRGAIPCSGARARRYRCTADEFLNSDTYLVRFVDSSRIREVSFNCPDAHPITIREYSNNSKFVSGLLDSWFNPNLGEIKEAQLIVMHCAKCDRRLVIDGVHRIVQIASKRPLIAKLTCIEISGCDWPKDTPDMNVVCSCR